MKRFYPAIITACIGLLLGGVVGMTFYQATLIAFFIGMWSVCILSSLESSMSLDNSVVASSILVTMSEQWQKRYLTWGMLIAVFGMRFAFPILIVSFSAHISPLKTLVMAVHSPEQYGNILESIHPEINAFGISFLLMISLSYFMNQDKNEHWLGFIEKPLAKIGRMTSLPAVISLIVTLCYSHKVSHEHTYSVLTAGIIGVVAFFLIKQGLPLLLGEDPTQIKSGTGGLGTFMYLECVDASFSFDGVIGAFAITNNIFIIAIGLGVGAMVVRCLTLWLVELKKKSLDSQNEEDAELDLPFTRFLENGAFFSVFALIICMYYNEPDYITGLCGIIILTAASLCGVYLKEEKEKEDLAYKE